MKLSPFLDFINFLSGIHVSLHHIDTTSNSLHLFFLFSSSTTTSVSYYVELFLISTSPNQLPKPSEPETLLSTLNPNPQQITLNPNPIPDLG